MENFANPSREELEALVEKAEKELQEKLDKMTPEERARAEIAAQKRIEEDQASIRKLLADAAAIAGGTAAKEAPKFCPSCGAPTDGEKFCAYCGMPL